MAGIGVHSVKIRSRSDQHSSLPLPDINGLMYFKLFCEFENRIS